jgi:hypothetical protein
MKALTYGEWIGNKGESQEIGVKALITDQLLFSSRDFYLALGKNIGASLSRFLRDNGTRLSEELSVSIERDEELRANEVLVLAQTIHGESPTEYVNLAYNAWQEEQAARITWENKTLWQYIKHWFYHKFRR